jgi:hypothetical protein
VGTAKCVDIVTSSKVVNFLNYHQIEYVHFIGCENIAEVPLDPLLFGLMHKFKRKVAAKCVEPTESFH